MGYMATFVGFLAGVFFDSRFWLRLRCRGALTAPNLPIRQKRPATVQRSRFGSGEAAKRLPQATGLRMATKALFALRE